MHTPNFRVHYHDPLAEAAQRVGQLCEQVRERLNNHLGLHSTGGTEVLLTDVGDDANGSATVVPRKLLRLFVQPPGDLSALGDYDDWLSLLITHESAHIHHLAEISGIPAVVNRLLGPTLVPNGRLPGWFVEGLATYEESALSSGGRLRSAIFEMYLRADALEGRLLELDQISHDPIRWPYGQLRYLYGAHFIHYLAGRFGKDVLKDMAIEHGRQAVPYGLNRIARRVTGVGLDALYSDFLATLKAKYSKLRKSVVTAGIVEGSPLVAPQNSVRSPRFLPDGRLIFFQDDGLDNLLIRTLDRSVVFRASSEAAVAPHDGGQQVLLSMVAPHRDVYRLHDLFNYNAAVGQLERLTHGLRAREPDVSPDGHRVAFITHGQGTAQLNVADIDDIEATRRVVLRAGPYRTLFTPRFSPNGETLAVSIQNEGGFRDILLVDVATGSLRPVTHDRAQDSGPTWHPNGSTLYFTSDRDGIHNLYEFQLKTGQTRRITRTLGGAFQAVVSPDGKDLVYVSYGSQGFGLRKLALARARSFPIEAPPTSRRPAPADLKPPRQRYAVTDYSPWTTLSPGVVGVGLLPGPLGYEIELSLTGTDIAAHHSYAAVLALGVGADPMPRAELAYTHRRSPLGPTVSFARRVRRRRDLEINGQPQTWLEAAYALRLGAGYNLPDLFSGQRVSIGYELYYNHSLDPFSTDLDPTAPAPVVPARGWFPSISAGYSYTSVVRQAQDVSPSSGLRARLNLSLQHPLLGRETKALRLAWDVTYYLRLPWAKAHVLALGYVGGRAAGDTGTFNRFALGGFPVSRPLEQVRQLLSSGIVDNLSGVALRGFPRSHLLGREFQLLQVEYRMPVLRLDQGLSTLPFYVRRIYGSLFTDAGNAYNGAFEPSSTKVGVGGELLTQLVVGYDIELTVRTGLAHGLGSGGTLQAYLNVGTPF